MPSKTDSWITRLNESGFSRVTLLSSGRAGAVYRAQRGKKTVALKVALTQDFQHQLQQEWVILQRLQQNCTSTEVGQCSFVPAYQLLKIENNPVLELKFIDGVTAARAFSYKTIEEKRETFMELCHLLIPIVKTLVVMHKIHVLHMDLHLDNLMLDNKTGRLLIIDFGAACMGQDCVPGGTFDPLYNAGMDLQTIATSFIKLMTGQSPWTSNNKPNIKCLTVLRQLIDCALTKNTVERVWWQYLARTYRIITEGNVYSEPRGVAMSSLLAALNAKNPDLITSNWQNGEEWAWLNHESTHAYRGQRK